MSSSLSKGESLTKILQTKGKNVLIREFINDKRKKNAIINKISNISGKTGQYFVPKILWQKRTARKNRSLIPFKHVSEGKITYEQLSKTFINGVTVEFVNTEFFDQLALPSCKQDPIFKKLKDKLGSDDRVSAIIDIRSTGGSSSEVQRIALKKLKEWLLQNNKYPIKDVLLKRKSGIKYDCIGNDKWQGFVYYNTKGGQHKGEDSHIDNNIDSRDVQLFNPSVEYAGEEVSDDITLVLIYFALFSISPSKRDYEWENTRDDYLNYFKTREYCGLNLKDYVTTHPSLMFSPGKLVDPIQLEEITIDDFTIIERSEDSLDIAHQSSVNRHGYIWDDKLQLLLTPARPTNIFWSRHLSNMMQQDYSLKEYLERQKKIMEKWKNFGLNNAEP